MNWDLIEVNWQAFKGHVKRQWDVLSDAHLDEIAGKRDQLVGKIQENYGVGPDEAECQVMDWEYQNRDVFAATAAQVAKHGVGPQGQ